MADAPKLVGTDSLRTAYPKINSAIDNANKARTESSTAADKASQAEITANSIQEQFDGVVLDGAIDPETAQARVNKTGKSFTTLKQRIDDIEKKYVDVTWFGAVGDGVTNNSTAFTNAISALSNGGVLYIPKGVYLVTSIITVSKSIAINGESKPYWNGTNLENGATIKGYGIVIQNTKKVAISNVGVECPNQANSFEIIGAASDVQFTDCVGVARDHCYLFQSYFGTVKNVDVLRCEAYNAVHGFISKAENVNFSKCKAYGCTTNGFGVVSDNIPAAGQKGVAIANKLTDCEAENCSYGFNFYARDYFSTTNTNGIESKGHTLVNCGAKNSTLLGFRLGDSIASLPAGQSYIRSKFITFSNCYHIGSNGFSIESNYCEEVSFVNFSCERPFNIQKDESKNLRIDRINHKQNKLSTFFDIVKLDATTTPSVNVGGGLFGTNNNGTITNLLSGKEEQIITLFFQDDSTTINSGGNFNLNRSFYKGTGSVLVLKLQDGIWFEVIGNRMAAGTNQRNLVTDGSPLSLRQNNVWDVYGTGTITNKIDFTFKNADSEIVTLIIRSSGGSFTFGGFNTTNFSVPASFPLTANFGTAIVSQWVFMTAINKWVCVSQTTAPY